MKRLPNGRWQVRWRDEERKQRARNFRTKELAQAFLRKLDRGQVEAEDEPEPVPTFAQFSERFLREHAALYRPATCRDDEARIKQHLIPALGARKLDALTKADLAKLLADLKAKPTRHGGTRDNVGVNNIVKVAKTMLETAVTWGLLKENPAKDVRYLPTPEKRMAYWTAEERDRFLAFCRQGDPAFAELVLVACFTGLRMGELRALRRYQLDFKNRLILVDATWNKRTKKRESRTKNGKAQEVRMVTAVADALRDRQLQAMEAPVFDESLFPDAYHRLRRRCRKYGVRPIRFHDLRHTYASTLVMAGVPIYDVQKLMRHESLSQTERYAHLSETHLAEAAERLCAPKVHSERIKNANN